MLAAGKIDTTQAGKLSKAWNISTLHVAQELNVLRAEGERQEPEVRSPELNQREARTHRSPIFSRTHECNR